MSADIIDLFAGATLRSRIDAIDRQIDRLQLDLATLPTQERMRWKVVERLQIARAELVICRAIIQGQPDA